MMDTVELNYLIVYKMTSEKLKDINTFKSLVKDWIWKEIPSY